MSVDVSVNVTAHNEGILLYKTLRSVLAGVKYANSNKITTELNISLDNADVETISVVRRVNKQYPEFSLNVYEVSLGDLGLSRNFLINKSSGRYLAFFDGDDFFTENFLTEAYKKASKNKQPAIYSAQFILNFEGSHYISKIHSSIDRDFNKYHMFETHFFVSQNLVDRRIFDKIKYKANKGQYGAEDWHFHSEALAYGFEILTVPDTIYCYRRKKAGSLLADQTNRSAVIRPTLFLQKEVFVKFNTHKAINSYGSDTVLSENLSLAKPHISTLKDKLRKHQLSYHYLKTMYNLNIGTIRALKVRYAGKAEDPSDQSVNPWSSPALIKERIALYSQSPPKRLADIGFTHETVKQWALINRFEPMIRSSWDMLEFIPIIEYPRESHLSENYMELCKKFLDKPIDELLIVPHIRRGGAEQATLHLAKALSEIGRSVLIVGTIETDSPWKNRVNEIGNVYLVEAQEIFKNIPDEDNRLTLLIKLIQNWPIRNVNVVNCELGYKLIMRYGQLMLEEGRKAFVHTYAFDVTEDGFIFNHIQNGLVECYNKNANFITDSKNFIKELVDINGFDKKRLNALYLPINPRVSSKQNYKKHNKVLFAGRIGQQKIPDVAVEVGKILEKSGISLDFFGNIDPEFAENDRFLKMIEEHPNINYKGSYDGFDTLATNDYDILLLTTKTEGMANVLLEACKANIYTVSVNIGGLSECIINGKNGYLIDAIDRFSPEKYADAILNAYKTNAFANKAQIHEASSRVVRDHSTKAYTNTVKKLMS